MPSKLRKLRLRRIDLVDKGANQGAFVTLFKNMAEEEHTIMPQDEPKATPVTDVEKRLVDLEKALADAEQRVADAEAEKDASADRIAKLEDSQRLQRAITSANLFKSLGNPDDLSGKLAKYEAQLDAETFVILRKDMESWNTKLAEAETVLTKELGVEGEGDTSLTSNLDKLAKAYRKDHGNGITYEQAYAEVIRTPEGKKLYSDIAKAGGN